jgi:arylsulfatase A-like enzyme
VTPNIDALAAQGIRFTSFYAAAPVCSPSRAALLTGRLPKRCGVEVLFGAKSMAGLPPGEVTLADVLKRRGYATACVGKWHLGGQPELLPTRRGFDRYAGTLYGHASKVPIWMEDERILERAESSTAATTLINDLTRRETMAAVRFIQESQGRPFFVYLAYSMPHLPLGVSSSFAAGRADKYEQVMSELDWGVGQLLEALAKAGATDNTIVVLASDNGAPLQESTVASNGLLRGGKLGYFEGGMRIPCIVRFPGRARAGRVESAPASLMDWFPTMVKWAHAGLPGDPRLDGEDIGPLILGTGRRPDENFFWSGAFRAGPWKLKGAELFNLEEDAAESRNVANSHPDVVARLLGLRRAVTQSIVHDAQRPKAKPKARPKPSR